MMSSNMKNDPRYCYIEDIQDLLKPEWVDRQGVKVKTNRILNRRAMDYMSGPMEMYCTLPKRTYEYLKKENRWVTAQEIRSLALGVGFIDSDVNRMFEEFLDHHPQVGSVYQGAPHNAYDVQEVPGYVGTIYKWYDMTPDELSRNQQALDAFDAL